MCIYIIINTYLYSRQLDYDCNTNARGDIRIRISVYVYMYIRYIYLYRYTYNNRRSIINSFIDFIHEIQFNGCVMPHV